MSRQAQNILMGSIACVVAAVAMIAVALALTGGSDDVTTEAIDPLASNQSDLGSAETGPVPLAATESEITTRSTLAITAALPTTTVAPSTTTTVATTVATTAVSVTTTTIATTTTTATAAAESSTTEKAGSSDSSSTTAKTGESNDSSATTEPTTSTTVEEAATTTTMATTTTVADGSSGGSLNDVEREIGRLTNELRTNPNGALKREGPPIDCDGRVLVDLETGEYQSIPALTIDTNASLKVARPWSAQLSRENFNHQPNAGIPALQAAGISVRSAGENIAYHNYPNKAMRHFTGWRESDGHFCNMMAQGFTHIGVGEVTKSDGISYATQSFYSTR